MNLQSDTRHGRPPLESSELPREDAVPSALTVLICTHNRADLLERVLVSLNAAKRPRMPVQILVAANACTDDTTTRLRAYQSRRDGEGSLPLQFIEVPTPGKSQTFAAATTN